MTHSYFRDGTSFSNSSNQGDIAKKEPTQIESSVENKPKKFNPACNHLIDVIWMCTKLFARPPISPQIAKNVFKGLGSRQILGESWVGRYLLPAAFSAENQKFNND